MSWPFFRSYSTCSLTILALMLWAFPGNASAMTCGSRHEINKEIIDRYQEKPVATGLVNEQVLIEIYASRQGSWTISLTNTHGVSCIIAAGTNWQVQIESSDPEA